MKSVAIIPARGGSKGIPKKNLKLFCGEPLIYWTIQAAKRSQKISTICVTSDSDEILEYCASLKVTTIKRPAELSTDSIGTEPALFHALNELGEKFNFSILLQTTSPIRFASQIDESIAMLESNQFDSVVSAVISDDFLIWHEKQKSAVSFNFNSDERGRRQDREVSCVENGSIYAFKTEDFLITRIRTFGRVGICPVPKWHLFELDEPGDWELVEHLFSAYLVAEKLKK